MKDNSFSSKPKQIAQAAKQVLTKVFGNLNKINLIVISDMNLTLNIGENFKHSGLKRYYVLEDSLDKFLKSDQNNKINFEKLLNILKDYEMIMIGFKNQTKIIDKDLVKEILKIRKQKPIFFIDCGIPGNISMDVGMIDNCFLFDLNDLEQLYSSWIENNPTNEDTNNELYDLELKNLLEIFFKSLDLNLNQKMIFEQKINSLLNSSGNENKLNLKKLLRALNKNG